MPRCCHPSCTMTELTNERENLALKFYTFPENHERKFLWLSRISCEVEKFKAGFKVIPYPFHEKNNPCTCKLLRKSIMSYKIK